MLIFRSWPDHVTRFRAAGEFEKATSVLEAVAALQKGLFGPQHPLVAETMMSLADVAFQRGHPDQSEFVIRRVLRLLEGGGSVLLSGMAHANLGAVFLERGDFKGAVSAYQRALDLLRPVLPKDDLRLRLIEEDYQRACERSDFS